MFDVTVKTLDSQNHVFNVEEETTVKQFKETICPTIGIPVEQQRLIFRGRVLQDDKPLAEYNVANNVVHVVQRPANQNSTANDEPPARPSSQAGSRLGDGGIFISGDDGGGGRNAVIMGAIGLPQIDIESGDEVLQPRRSGAQVRLMVGNRMLNRASNLLQRLEDSEVVASTVAASESSSEAETASGSGGQESPEVEAEGRLNSNALMEVDDDQDEQDSIEQMISQVVNVSSSAAALVAEIRQVQPETDLQPNSSSTNATPPTNANSSSSGTGSGTAAATSDSSSVPDVNVNVNAMGAGGIGGGGGGGNSSNSNNGTTSAPRTSNLTASPSRRPEEPRLRELSTALQDFLALQTRLNPYLRFVQNAIRQNRLYTEQGESESTQFVYDTMFSILHHLSHSLHAFSEIMCDFSVRPENRRLSATSSILMEQSTVVRATIPVAAVPAAMLGGGGGGGPPQPGSSNTPGISVSIGSAMPQNATAGRNSATLSGPHQATFQLGGGGIQGIPLNIPLNIPGMQGIPGIQPWRNPNIAANIANAATRGGGGNSGVGGVGPTVPSNNSQPSQQNNSSGNGGGGGNQFQAGMLPPGLNLGALLGMAGASGGMVNIFGAGGDGQGPPGQPIPLGSFRIGSGGGGAGNNNNSSATGGSSQEQASATPTSTASAMPPPNSTIPNASSQGGAPNGNQARNNNAAMFQNLLSNFNRPQFDPLLPCHTHHTSGRSRTNRPRPAEFRRFVNVEESNDEQNGVIGRDEAETVEILIDLLRHSSLFDFLQPIIKDVVLNYLMRGRDAKNEAHIKTCARGLVKKILPFFEKFSAKVGTSDGSVDVLATYSNILTRFLTGLMQKVIGQSPAGDGQFKSELTASLTDLQRHLIQAFKVCYPSCTNVGLQFVYYFVDTCLGGMSLTFKGHVQQKLLDHLKEIEKTATSDDPKSFIVYKQQTSASGTSATVPSTSTSSVASNSPSAAISSRCAASFVRSASSGPDVSMTPPKKPAVSTTVDDVDIDEVLEMPTPPVNSIGAVGGGGRGNLPGETSSIAAMLRNLPSEWADTIEQDIRRQLEMPSQPSFSPGYNTLFPRKH